MNRKIATLIGGLLIAQALIAEEPETRLMPKFSLGGIEIGMNAEDVALRLASLATGSRKIQSFSYDQKAFFQFQFQGDTLLGAKTAVDVSLDFKEDIQFICKTQELGGKCAKAVPSYVTLVTLKVDEPAGDALRDVLVKTYGQPTRQVAEQPSGLKLTFLNPADAKANQEIEAMVRQAAADQAAKEIKMPRKDTTVGTKGAKVESVAPTPTAMVDEWCLTPKCAEDEGELLRYTNGTATLIGKALAREIFAIRQARAKLN